MNRPKSLTKLDSIVTELPRGGVLVDTSIGYVQFGSPPETIKDTMLLPKGTPSVFILPNEYFDPEQKISMAEIEFPIYYNFFIKQKKAHVFVFPEQVEYLKVVLQEAIFGPKELDLTKDFEEGEKFIPNLKAEIDYFRAGRKLEDLVTIHPIHEGGFKMQSVTVKPQEDKSFVVYDGDKEIAHIPAILKSKVLYDLGSVLKEPFIPPKFGITCLGPSHGFDPEQNTSGFLLWINKVGIMVDPPVNSTSWLRDSNVNPKLIDSVILTHCHADHDAGTFQKILEENKITIYTTPTIMQSFLRKYSAMIRIHIAKLMNMFKFSPVKIKGQHNIHGAIFSFFYSLHSIPTMGFSFAYRDKTFVYSSDHLNEPNLILDLQKKGVLSQERVDDLFSFPWDYDLIYHEAGIPPLHTPVTYLNSLPEETQKRITVYHIASKDFPEETNLKLAKFGIGETVYPKIAEHKFEDAYEILDVFSRIDIFQHLPFDKTKDLLLAVNEVNFKKGDYIIKKGSNGDMFYVIVSGNVAIEGIENVENKVYGTFEYFGEASLLFNTKRSADVVAATNVRAFAIEKHSFLRLIKNTKIETLIRNIAKIRDGKSWNAIKKSKFFSDLSSSQITQLESILNPHEYKKDEIVLEKDAKINSLFLVAEGQIISSEENREYSVGRLIPVKDFFVHKLKKSSDTFAAKTDSLVYNIDLAHFDKFLKDNPGVLMKLLYLENEEH